ncbi:MAG: molybdate ABC transporter substrate-binding protein, partial [Bacteroidota bacterium]
MKRLIALLVIFCFFSSFSKAQESIRVAVAANLIFPIQAVRETFEKQYPNISIEIITASSGKLAAQIKNSAPFHIFIAADIFYPQNLFDNKFAKEVPQIITYGNLVLWTKHPITEKKTVGFLNEALNKTIAIAQPE